MKLRRTTAIDDAIAKWQQMQGSEIAKDRISISSPNPESASSEKSPARTNTASTSSGENSCEKNEDRGGNSLAADLGAAFGPEWIEHTFFIKLAAQLNTPLRVLGKGSGVYIPPKPAAPAKPKEYVELMERLKREAQEKEYQELVGRDFSQQLQSGAALDAQELKQVKEEVSTIFNILISVVAVAWAIWYWTPYWPLPARTLLCLFGAILILVAEVVVYLGYRRRVNEARALEQAKKERKFVVEFPGETLGKTLGESLEKGSDKVAATATRAGTLSGPMTGTATDAAAASGTQSRGSAKRRTNTK